MAISVNPTSGDITFNVENCCNCASDCCLPLANRMKIYVTSHGEIEAIDRAKKNALTHSRSVANFISEVACKAEKIGKSADDIMIELGLGEKANELKSISLGLVTKVNGIFSQILKK